MRFALMIVLAGCVGCGHRDPNDGPRALPDQSSTAIMEDQATHRGWILAGWDGKMEGAGQAFFFMGRIVKPVYVGEPSHK